MKFYGDPELNESSFEKRFSEDEIYEMAKKIDNSFTLEQIQERLGVSYRQSRKIKEVAENAISIITPSSRKLSAE